VRERDAGVRTSGDGRRNAGYDLERNACARQADRLLRTARKHERIAAFEPHDPLASATKLDQLFGDRILKRAVALAEAFTHVAHLGVRTELEQRGMRERVVQHHLRL